MDIHMKNYDSNTHCTLNDHSHQCFPALVTSSHTQNVVTPGADWD